MNELKDSQPQNPKAAMVEILTEQSDIPAKLGRITQLLHQYRDAEYVKGSAIFVPERSPRETKDARLFLIACNALPTSFIPLITAGSLFGPISTKSLYITG